MWPFKDKNNSNVGFVGFSDAGRAERRRFQRTVKGLAAEVELRLGSQNKLSEAPELPQPHSITEGWKEPQNLAGSGGFNPSAMLLSSRTISAAFPFLTGPAMTAPGPVIGKGLYGTGSFRFDPWEMYKAGIISSMSAVLMGSVGEGKSSLAKVLAMRFVQHGYKLAVMSDPKGEWTVIVKALSGTAIQIGSGLDARINPLDPGVRPSKLPDGRPTTDVAWKGIVRARRTQLLATLMNILSDHPLTTGERRMMNRALDAAVRKHGTDNVIIPHLIEVLREEDPKLSDDSLKDAKLVAESLGRIVGSTADEDLEGDISGMFDGPTTVTFDHTVPAVSVDTSALATAGKTAKRIVNACVASWVESMITNPDGGQRMCIYEEGWDNINSESDLLRMMESWKLARFYGIWNLLIMHKLGDLDMAGDEGSRLHATAKSLLADAGIKIMFRQDESEMKHLMSQLGLSEHECDIVRSLKKGQAMWRIKHDTHCVEATRTDAEIPLCDTDEALTRKDFVEGDNSELKAA